MGPLTRFPAQWFNQLHPSLLHSPLSAEEEAQARAHWSQL